MQSNSILENYPKLKTKLEGGEKVCIAICTPMYGGVGVMDYFASLMKTKDLLTSVGVEYRFYSTKQESLVQRARNTLACLALSLPEVTHIFFIDADIKWNEFDVLLLLENDVDIVGGIYPKKAYNFKKVMESSNIISLKNSNKFNSEIPDETFLKHHLVDYNLNTCGSTKIENGLLEVRHIATGFMMIKRTVFEQMILAHPEWEYEDDCHNPPLEIKCYAFFDCIIKEKHYLSEDWTFCERWREMEGHIHANITIALGHIGTVEYEGRILSTLGIN
jgi:hypothetical protein